MNKRIIGVLVLLLLLSGCASGEKLFAEKKVKIAEEYVTMDVTVEDFLKNKSVISFDNLGKTLTSKDTMICDLGAYRVVVYNANKEDLSIDECLVLGISQNIQDIEKGTTPIVFPEGLQVGMKISSEELSEKLTSVGEVHGDVGITKDGNVEYIICGDRWIDLGVDWVSQSGKATYPVEIILEDGVIVSLSMIFID